MLKKTVLLSYCLLYFVLLSGCEQEQATAPPNILFIAIDDLRPELGPYGNPHIKTPHIDQLAQTGTTFMQAHVQQAVCSPSRSSLMTGLRPDSLRVWDLQTRFRDNLPDVVTLPQYFKQHGYHSVAIGKLYHNTIPDSLSWSEPKLHVDGYPFDPDAVYRHPDNVAIQEARKAEIIAAGDQDRYIDQYGQWYLKAASTEIVDLPDNVYYDGAQTDVALEKLEELKTQKQPFFFGIGFYRPHLPFNAPKKYWDLYDPETIPAAEDGEVPADGPVMAINNMRELRGYSDFKDVAHPFDGGVSPEDARRLKHGYYASVSYIDAQVGRLLDKLEALGLAENTIVVLWGDHGWKLGEHNSWGKMTNYDIDTHAPLIIRSSSDANHSGSTQVNHLVEFVDIYPSLCELAGLPIPEDLQGSSFVSLINNPHQEWKEAVFSQFFREGIWIAPDGVEYMGYSMRTSRFHYVRWMNWATKEFVATELYNLAEDPGENTNLAGLPAYADDLAQLEQMRLAGWRGARPAGL